jgi:hypothetical protein
LTGERTDENSRLDCGRHGRLLPRLAPGRIPGADLENVAECRARLFPGRFGVRFQTRVFRDLLFGARDERCA